MIAAANIPLARAGPVEEAADRITFLVSRQASYLTGSQFTIDGGVLPTLWPPQGPMPGIPAR